MASKSHISDYIHRDKISAMGTQESVAGIFSVIFSVQQRSANCGSTILTKIPIIMSAFPVISTSVRTPAMTCMDGLMPQAQDAQER